MRKHLQGIDHVVIAVNDIARSAASYRRLGFTLTPQGRHTTGSENHCIMFERDYFELLSAPVAHPVTRYYREFVAQGEGLAALALATDDARGFPRRTRGRRDRRGCAGGFFAAGEARSTAPSTRPSASPSSRPKRRRPARSSPASTSPATWFGGRNT